MTANSLAVSSRAQLGPNFFIVGAAKAGTTSLYQYLKSHAQVFLSDVKEPHHFSPAACGNPGHHLRFTERRA
jgi:hypothetical protein